MTKMYFIILTKKCLSNNVKMSLQYKLNIKMNCHETEIFSLYQLFHAADNIKLKL